jgi:hypothetical protein
LRIVSFGGWLAHMTNQNQLMNWDNSRSIRPGLVLLLIFGFGLGPVVIAANSVLYVLGMESNLPFKSGEGGPVLLVCLIFGGISILLAVGWLVRFLPFVPDSCQTPAPVGPLGMGSSVSMHATGIVGVRRRQSRFRHRPGVVERRGQNELHVLVKLKTMIGSDVTGPWATAESARLLPSNISKVRRGTAHLVTETRPAIELRWLHGPILLDFPDTESRDRVYAELASWRRRSDH